MSKFNEKENKKVVNLAGGKVYKETKEMQLVSMLLTSFGDDKYYQSNKDIVDKLKALIEECDTLFCAKAIVYARKQFGMRTITHIASSLLARKISSKEYAKDFFSAVINRPDDMTEIIAYHFSRKEKLSNAMKKGFAKALGRFTDYQLAKYKSSDKAVKLIDVVNMVHPRQTNKNNGGIERLVNGELKSFDTWEVELSAAGSDIEKKKAAWRKLLSENKLGYFALLRNVRNILLLGDENLNEMAFEALVNRDAIKKSLVLPFRFSTAYDELRTISSDAMRYISRACEIACDNVPKLDGKTLVALDVSGSMWGVSNIAALFAAVLIKSNKADLIKFAYDAEYVNLNTDDSLMTIKNNLNFCGGGTNFQSVFERANKKYDRVILLSDMQSWYNNFISPKAAFERYKVKFNAPNCKFYSIDLQGYGTMQMPQQDVYCLAGFSEKIFDLMRNLEEDKDALINAINNVKLGD